MTHHIESDVSTWPIGPMSLNFVMFPKLNFEYDVFNPTVIISISGGPPLEVGRRNLVEISCIDTHGAFSTSRVFFSFRRLRALNLPDLSESNRNEEKM